jgi:putative component of toxin-antitoxin plasmid stabilization module
MISRLEDIVDTDFNEQLFDEFIKINAKDYDVLEYLSEYLEMNGDYEKSKWLKKQIEQMAKENAPKVSFLALNNRVNIEIGEMQKLQRKTLFRVIEKIKFNPEFLNGNYADIGFVKQGVESLRDIKKHGKGGFRVYFTFIKNQNICVIIGVSDSKSTTDVDQEEIDNYIKMADRVQNNFDLLKSKMPELKIINEAMIAVCFKPSDKLLESVNGYNVFILNTDIFGGDKVVCKVNESEDFISKFGHMGINEATKAIYESVASDEDVKDMVGIMVI